MDQVTAQAAQWCEQARRLCEAHQGAGSETLSNRLDCIGAGFLLRRQLDPLGPGEATLSTRRAVLRDLAELQKLIEAELDSHPLEKACHELISAWSKDWLDKVRLALHKLTSTAAADSLPKALAIEGLRGEVEWQGALLDRLDRETSHPASAALDVELSRVAGAVGSVAMRDNGHMPLAERCDRMQAVMLNRRIKRELAQSNTSSSPEALWAHRFHLTRLQAQAETLEQANGTAGAKAHNGQDHRDWIGELDRRRDEFSELAERRLRALDLPDRIAPCERIVQTALDEVGETTAFLEEMSLRRAVDRLKLLGDDLAVLEEASARWRELDHHASAPANFPEEIFLPPHGPDGGATAGVIDGAEQDRISATEEKECEDAARYRLRKQAQVIGRARRQVERQWQEKLLELRMEKLVGRRAAAILENTVLVLILVLFFLILSEAVLERVQAQGLSAWQHWFFAGGLSGLLGVPV